MGYGRRNEQNNAEGFWTCPNDVLSLAWLSFRFPHPGKISHFEICIYVKLLIFLIFLVGVGLVFNIGETLAEELSPL